jgi:hypothetical protein
MVERAKLYQKYNVDIMSITPSWMSPTFAGNEELANTLWKDLISAVRKEFSGKIHVELSVYGFLSGFDEKENYNKYDYYKNADIVETRIYSLWGEYKTRNNPDFPEMKFGINKLLSDLDVRSKNEGIKLSVFFAPFSYQNAINDGIVEFLDVNNQKTIETVSKVDYNHQASAYQALFESLKIGRASCRERVY